MLKNVDVGVFDTIKALTKGEFVSGLAVYGAKEDGVGVTNFEFTKEIIGAEKLAKFEEIKAKLMAGEIKVSDK